MEHKLASLPYARQGVMQGETPGRQYFELFTTQPTLCENRAAISWHGAICGRVELTEPAGMVRCGRHGLHLARPINSSMVYHRRSVNQWPLRCITTAVKTPSLNPIRTESPNLGLCSSVTAMAPNGNSSIWGSATFTMAAWCSSATTRPQNCPRIRSGSSISHPYRLANSMAAIPFP